jgi:hypothetical protein
MLLEKPVKRKPLTGLIYKKKASLEMLRNSKLEWGRVTVERRSLTGD